MATEHEVGDAMRHAIMQASDEVFLETLGKTVEQLGHERGRLRARRLAARHGVTKSSDGLVGMVGLACHAAENVTRRHAVKFTAWPSDQTRSATAMNPGIAAWFSWRRSTFSNATCAQPASRHSRSM